MDTEKVTFIWNTSASLLDDCFIDLTLITISGVLFCHFLRIRELHVVVFLFFTIIYFLINSFGYNIKVSNSCRLLNFKIYCFSFP